MGWKIGVHPGAVVGETAGIPCNVCASCCACCGSLHYRNILLGCEWEQQQPAGQTCWPLLTAQLWRCPFDNSATLHSMHISSRMGPTAHILVLQLLPAQTTPQHVHTTLLRMSVSESVCRAALEGSFAQKESPLLCSRPHTSNSALKVQCGMVFANIKAQKPLNWQMQHQMQDWPHTHLHAAEYIPT